LRTPNRTHATTTANWLFDRPAEEFDRLQRQRCWPTAVAGRGDGVGPRKPRRLSGRLLRSAARQPLPFIASRYVYGQHGVYARC